jgi:transposase
MKRAVGQEITAEQRAEVEAVLRRRDLTPRVRERLEMVKARALGQDRATIAAWSGRTVRTVERWLRRFGQGGAAAVADAPRAGRPPRAAVAYRQALERAVDTPPRELERAVDTPPRELERAVDTPPRELGLPFDVWTSARF